MFVEVLLPAFDPAPFHACPLVGLLKIHPATLPRNSAPMLRRHSIVLVSLGRTVYIVDVVEFGRRLTFTTIEEVSSPNQTASYRRSLVFFLFAACWLYGYLA